MARPRKPRGPFVLNRDSIQAKGLIGWWPGFPAGGPKLYDISGRNHHGALTNFDAPYSATSCWRGGVDGGFGALRFNLTNTVNLGDNFGGMTALSVSCWYSAFTTNATINRALVAKFGNESAFDSSDSFALGVQAFGSRGLTFALGGPNVVLAATVNQGDATTAIYHGVATYDGTTAKVYLNGKLVNSGAASGALNAASGTNCLIGGEVAGTPGGNFDGFIEDVRIYNRALTAAEVWAMYDPKTRWELRYVTGRKIPGYTAAGALTGLGRLVGTRSGLVGPGGLVA